MDQADPNALRWHLRFANFRSALALLREAADDLAAKRLNLLEREGLIQRFEYTWELGWKSMRDYLVESGVTVPLPTPPNVIRAAFQVGLIEDGDAWIKAKNDRNIASHEYALDEAERIASDVFAVYVPLLSKLEERLEHESRSGN